MTGHRISWASAKDTAALVPLMQALYAHETPDALPQNDEATQDHLRALLAPGTPHRP